MTALDHPPAPDSRAYWVLHDCGVLIGRNLRHILRNPEQIGTAVLVPTMILLLFRFMFSGAVDTGQTTYVNYLIAGIIVLSVSVNATSTTVGVHVDMKEGVVDRFRSMPMATSAVLTGHVAAAIARNAVSIAMMVAVGLLIGFRPVAGFAEWAAALGMLLLYSLALAWIAAILGLLSKTVDGASGYSLFLVFVPYLSSAFVPTGTLPDALRVFVENQPVTLVMDTVRPLMVGGPVGDTGLLAVIWWVAILLVAVPVASALFRRRASR